jgi:hypothetical protein
MLASERCCASAAWVGSVPKRFPILSFAQNPLRFQVPLVAVLQISHVLQSSAAGSIRRCLEGRFTAAIIGRGLNQGRREAGLEPSSPHPGRSTGSPTATRPPSGSRSTRSGQHLFNRLPFAYEANPQTLVYLGYADDRDGVTEADGRVIPVRLTGRVFFAKLSYAWRP